MYPPGKTPSAPSVISGPAPAVPNETSEITTHLYQSGKSRMTDLCFSQSWQGYEALHAAFVHWLRTVYSAEEISRQDGPSTFPNHSTGIPALVTPPDPPVPANPAERANPPPGVSSHFSPQPESSTLGQTGDESPDRPASQSEPTPETSQSSPSTPQDMSNPRLSPPLVPAPPPLTPQGGNKDRQGSPQVTQLLSPRPLLSEPTPTVPPIGDTDQPMGGSSSLVTDRNHAERVPPPPGIFTFNDASPFITPAAIGYLQTIPAGKRWVNMVTSYLCLKGFSLIKGSPMRLPSAKSRPDEVSTWMKTQSYASTQVPFICDVGVYSGTWITWWASCQPAWRQNKGWPLPRDGSATWGAKSWARGHNGLFLVVMSTAWWASSIQSAKDWVEFDEAVEDVQWVLDQLITSFETLPAPAPPTRSDIPKVPVPAQGATWMARESGKCQPKPSRRLLEGGGI